MGRLIAPATAVFHSDYPAQRATSLELEGATFIPVDHEWLTLLHPEDRVTLNDTRDAHRVATVKGVTDTHATVEFADTTYVATGIRLIAPGGRETRVGRLPALEQSIVLHPGDVLTLTQDLSPVDPRELRIGCTLPDALAAARTGQRVLFDDGKIAGLVVDVSCGEIEVSIVSAAPRGTKLRAEKGISLPDTDLDVAALRSEDLLLLPLIAECADLVGLSFAQRADDITALQGHLEAIGGAGLGIVLKVETVRGFNRLPEMLLAAMASERVGVMVARGDLAVECGFERLAEVQEEILWLCEAAHIPTIWATQVLDQLARTGRPSRAEISDAFMAGRAECVMLNKGPHISEAVTALDDILGRMDSYQHKKTALLRRLTSWSQAPT
jgi:pyruvate kinase